MRQADTYLITGGAGFVGSHLAEALLSRGDRVIALDNLSTGSLRNLEAVSGNPGINVVHGSVLDELLVDELVNQCDVIVHLAAAVGVKLIVEHPLRSFTTNIRGSEIVIEDIAQALGNQCRFGGHSWPSTRRGGRHSNSARIVEQKRGGTKPHLNQE